MSDAPDNPTPTDDNPAHNREQKRTALERRALWGLGGLLVLAVIAAVFAVLQSGEAQRQAAQAVENLELAVTQEAIAQENADSAATRAAEAMNREAIARENADLAATRAAEAEQSAAEAVRERQIAQAQYLAAIAPQVADRSNQDDVATLLAVEAHRLATETGADLNPLIDNSLRRVLSKDLYRISLPDDRPYSISTAENADRFITLNETNQLAVRTLSLYRMSDLTRLAHIDLPFDTGAALIDTAGRHLMVTAGNILYTAAPAGIEDGTAELEPIFYGTGPNPINLMGFAADTATFFFFDNGVLNFIDLSTDEPTAVTMPDDIIASTIVFHPNNRHAAVGLQDGDILIWDYMAREEIVRVDRRSQSPAERMAFSPDGRYLAAVDEDGLNDETATQRLLVWQTADYTAAPFRPPLSAGPLSSVVAFNSVLFSPDNSYLLAEYASTPPNGTGRNTHTDLWNTFDLTNEPNPLSNHTDTQGRLVFSPDGRYLAAGAANPQDRSPVSVYDLENTGAYREISGEFAFFPPDKKAAFLGGRRLFLSGGILESSNGVWMIDDTPAHPQTFAVGGDARPVSVGNEGQMAMAVLPDQEESGVAYRAADESFITTLRTADLTDCTFATTVEYTGREGYVLLGSTGSTGVCYDVRLVAFHTPGLKNYRLLAENDHTFRCPQSQTDAIHAAREAGLIFVSSRPNSEIRTPFETTFWALPATNNEPVQEQGTFTGCVAAVSADGRYVVREFSDRFDLYDVQAETSQPLPDGLEKPTLNADGSRLAYLAPNDGRTLWYLQMTDPTDLDPVRFTAVPPIDNNMIYVAGLRLSGDGRQIALTGPDSALLIDADDPTAAPISIGDRNVTALDLSPNGRYLLTNGEQNTVSLRPLPRLADLLAAACDTVARNLTADEWTTYLGDQPYRATCPDRFTPQTDE